MLILCIYVRCEPFLAHNPTYISRRGNIVSSPFIWLRRLAMPLFCGRKAQVSRLFLLHRLAGSVRHGSGFKTVTT